STVCRRRECTFRGVTGCQTRHGYCCSVTASLEGGFMNAITLASLSVVSLLAAQVQIPQPNVPQVMTIEGTWVRAAYKNEGYAIIGYRLANLSVGDEWMLLEFGTTLREGMPYYKLKRSDLS